MRLVPLAFLAYLQGWIAIPALLIASTWRFFMGEMEWFQEFCMA